MAYRKRTLRKMLPVTRKLARLASEAGSLSRRLKSLVEEIKKLEEKDTKRLKETQEVLDRIKGE